MKTVGFNKRATVCIVSLTFVIFLLLFVGAEVNQWLRYSKTDLMNGQLWRLFSAHLVHLNLSHGLMNLAAFIVIVLLVGNVLTIAKWVSAFVFLSFMVSGALFVLSPEIVWYVGLSGVLHGILVLGLVMGSIAGDKLHIVALLVVLGKIIREQLPSFDVNHLRDVIDGAVVVDAHLYGAVGGLMIAVLFYLQQRFAENSVRCSL